MTRKFAFLFVVLMLLPLCASASSITYGFSSQSFRVTDTAVVGGQAVAAGYDSATGIPYKYSTVGGMAVATALQLPTGAIRAEVRSIDKTGTMTGEATFAGGVTRMITWSASGTPTVVSSLYGSTNMFGAAVSGGNAFGSDGGAPISNVAGTTTASPLGKPVPTQYAIADAQTTGATTIVVGAAGGTYGIMPFWTGSGTSFSMNSVACPGSVCSFTSLDQTGQYAGVSIDGQAGYYDFATGGFMMFGIDGTPDAIVKTTSGIFAAINNTADEVPYARRPDGSIDLFTTAWLRLNPSSPLPATLSWVNSLNLFGSNMIMGGNGSPVFALGDNPFGNPSPPVESPVPEPSTYALVAVGLLGAIVMKRRSLRVSAFSH